MEKGILDSRSGPIVVELFAIHCTTCRARLKVNEESAIGQILACPKCGSMVQVVPPVDWQRASAAAAVVAPVVKPAAPASVQAVWSAENSRTALPEQTVKAPAASPAEATTATLMPVKATAVSASTKLAALGQVLLVWVRRDWLALTGGIVLGSGVWLLIAMTTSDPPAADAVGQTGPQVASRHAVAVNHADIEPTVPVDPEAADVSEASVEPSEPSATSPPASAVGELTPPVDAPPAVVAPQEPNKTAPLTADLPGGPKVKLEPAPAVAAPAEAAEVADAPSQVDQKAPEPPQIGAVPDRPGQSPGSTPRMLSKSEIEDRLAQPLPTVEFTKTTLIHFVDFMQDLTGVTITIDQAALAKAGLSRQSPLSLKLSDTTAGDALRGAAERLGLQVAVQGGNIVITGPRD